MISDRGGVGIRSASAVVSGRYPPTICESKFPPADAKAELIGPLLTLPTTCPTAMSSSAAGAPTMALFAMLLSASTGSMTRLSRAFHHKCHIASSSHLLQAALPSAQSLKNSAWAKDQWYDCLSSISPNLTVDISGGSPFAMPHTWRKGLPLVALLQTAAGFCLSSAAGVLTDGGLARQLR